MRMVSVYILAALANGAVRGPGGSTSGHDDATDGPRVGRGLVGEQGGTQYAVGSGAAALRR